MTTVTVTEARNSLLELLRGAEERGDAVQITRNGKISAVLVSAEEWESLLETVEILSDAATVEKLASATQELERGRFLTHEEVWGKNDLPAPVSPSRTGRPRRASSRRPESRAPRARTAGRKPPNR